MEAKGYTPPVFTLPPAKTISHVALNVLASPACALFPFSAKGGWRKEQIPGINVYAELLEQMNLAVTLVNQIRTPLFFNKKSTGSCHRDKDYATKPVSPEENGFIAPQNGSLSLCPSFTPRSLKTLQLPHLNTIAPGGGENGRYLWEIISKLPPFPLLLSVLISSCSL